MSEKGGFELSVQLSAANPRLLRKLQIAIGLRENLSRARPGKELREAVFPFVFHSLSGRGQRLRRRLSSDRNRNQIVRCDCLPRVKSESANDSPSLQAISDEIAPNLTALHTTRRSKPQEDRSGRFAADAEERLSRGSGAKRGKSCRHSILLRAESRRWFAHNN